MDRAHWQVRAGRLGFQREGADSPHLHSQPGFPMKPGFFVPRDHNEGPIHPQPPIFGYHVVVNNTTEAPMTATHTLSEILRQKLDLLDAEVARAERTLNEAVARWDEDPDDEDLTYWKIDAHLNHRYIQGWRGGFRAAMRLISPSPTDETEDQPPR